MDIIEENEKLEASESESDMVSIPIVHGKRCELQHDFTTDKGPS
jgi:hypothetical protein